MCIMVLQKVAQVGVKRKSDTQGGLRRNGFARVKDEWVNALLLAKNKLCGFRDQNSEIISGFNHRIAKRK